MGLHFKQIDGDTFHVVDDKGNVVDKIRIGGVDTLESQPNANPTPLGKVVSRYVEALDPEIRTGEEHDKYGRSIGEAVDQDGNPIGARVVRQGGGFSMSRENDQAFRDFIARGRETETDPELEAILQEMDAYRAGPKSHQSPYSQIDPRKNHKGGTGERGWDRGVNNLKASGHAFLQALNNVVGDDEASSVHLEQAKYFAEQAGLIRKDVNSYADVDSLSKAAVYAYELLAEEAPSMAIDLVATAATGSLGAAIGRRTALSSIRSKMGQEAFEKAMAKHPSLMEDVAASGSKAGLKTGGAAGYVASGYPQEAGAVQQELNDNGLEDQGATALAVGAVSAGVQALPELALASKLLKAADVDASDLGSIVGTAKEIVKHTAGTAAGEGAAEAAATTLQKSAVALHRDEYEVFSDENIRDIKESAVAGATLGGLLGGGGTVGASAYRKADEIYREKRQAAIEARADLANEQRQSDQEQAQAQAHDEQMRQAMAQAEARMAPEQPKPKTELEQVFEQVGANTVATAEAPAEQQVEVPAEQRVEVPVAQQAEVPAEQQAEVPAEQQAEVPVEQQAEVPVEQQAEVPAEQQAEVPVAQQAEQQVEVPVAQQAEVPAEQQAEVPVEQQAEVPVEQQAEVPVEQQATSDDLPDELADVFAQLEQEIDQEVENSEVDSAPTPPPTDEQIASMRNNKAFQHVAARINPLREHGFGLVDGALYVDDLPSEAQRQLEEFDAIVTIDTSNGPKRIVHPQLVDDVIKYADPSPPKSIMHEAPTSAKSAKQYVDHGETFGDGNETADGVYDRGTGRSVFTELADLVANPDNMRQAADGKTKATNKFVDMVATIDPLSPEFDDQLRALAAYAKTWGKDLSDTVTLKMDSARLGDPNHARTVPVLKEVRKKLMETIRGNLKGEALTKAEAAAKFIGSLSQSLARTVDGFEHAPHFLTQLDNIIDVLQTGEVKLNAKQQSVVHAIASNSYASSSGLWLPRSDKTSRIVDSEKSKVTAAQNAPTKESVEPLPEFIAPRRNTDAHSRTTRTKKVAKAEASLRTMRAARKRLLAIRENQPIAEIEALTNKINETMEFISKNRVDDGPDRATLLKNVVEAKAILKRMIASRERLLAVKDNPQLDVIRALGKSIQKIVGYLNDNAGLVDSNPKRSRALARLAAKLADNPEAYPNLVSALASRHAQSPDVQMHFEDDEGKSNADPSLRVDTVDDRGSNSADATDIDGGQPDFEFDIADITEDEEKFINDFIRTRLGITKGVVDEMPLAVRLESFAKHFVDSTSGHFGGEPAHRETKSERRVRMATTLQRLLSSVGSIKSVFVSHMLDVETRGERYDTEEEARDARNRIYRSEDFQLEMKELENALFKAVFDRTIDGNNPDFDGINDFHSARSRLFELRGEVQSRKKGFEAPSDAVVTNMAGDLIDVVRPKWAYVEDKPESTGDAFLDSLMAEAIAAGDELAQYDAPLGGKTSREMYDVSSTLTHAINSAVRMHFEAQFDGVNDQGVSDMIRNGDAEGFVEYAIAHDMIPAPGNGLDKLINTTAELAAANQTASIAQYIERGVKTKKKGVISINLVSPDGKIVPIYLNVLGYISNFVDALAPRMIDVDHAARAKSDMQNDGVTDNTDPLDDRARFDRIAHIQDAFSQLINTLADNDTRLYGFKVDRADLDALLRDDRLHLYGEGADRVTLSDLRDTQSSRAAQVEAQRIYELDHDVRDTKIAKATAARELEAAMVDLFRIVNDKDPSKLLTLAKEVTRKNGRIGDEAAIKKAVTNIKRQLGALFRTVYGFNLSHLDEVNDYDYRQYEKPHDILFTRPSLHGSELNALENIAKDALIDSDRSRLKEKSDYTKTTRLTDMEYVGTILDAMGRAGFELTGPVSKDEAVNAYDRLISARERLSLVYGVQDLNSAKDDASDGEWQHQKAELETQFGTPSKTVSTNQSPVSGAKPGLKTRLLRKYGDKKESVPATSAKGKLTVENAGSRKVTDVVREAVIRMSDIVFGLGSGYHNAIDVVNADEAYIEYDHNTGRVTIGLPMSNVDENNPKAMVGLIRRLAHEFGHATATIENMNPDDAETAMEYYLKEVPDADRGRYTANEWLADLVAMNIVQDIAKKAVERPTLDSAIGTLVNKLVYAATRVLRSIASVAKQFGFDGKDFSAEQMDFAQYLLEKRRLQDDKLKLSALAGQERLHYTTRDAVAGMAKAKAKAAELTSGGLDSAIVKLFKPTAQRLQKIDRTLARMFFNPPGATQEQGIGLLDLAVNTRTQFVRNFNRLYPKVDSFRMDYTKFLETGKASAALNSVFERAGQAYSRVNPQFKYSGVPLMLDIDEVARRGAEFVALLGHENADALLSSFDRTGGDATNNTNIRPANPFGRQELIDELIRNRPEVQKKLQAAGFFESPTVAGLNRFLGGVSMRIEFERVFGGYETISSELGLVEYSPNHKLRERMDKITDPAKRREAVAMIGSMLGFDGARVHPAWRRTQDWTISVVSAMILPLSGFASLPDPMMPFVRTRSWKEATIGLFNVVKSYATDYRRTKELVRSLSLVTNSIQDTVWGHVVANRDKAGFPERLSEVLFRANGLHFLTNLSRNVSAVLAMDMLRRHSGGNTAYSRQFLSEMGISADDAQRVIAYMDQNGTVPQYTPGDDATNELHDMAQRVVTVFTNSSLIHPNKAQLPAIANDPNFRVLTLLKPFLYGFHSTVYGGNLRAGRANMRSPKTLGEFIMRSPAGAMPLIMAFGIMMPFAAAGLMLREMFSDAVFGTQKVAKLDAMDDLQYLNRIFARAGGYGMLEYPMQIWEATQVDYRSPVITAAGSVAGTLNTAASDIRGAFVDGNRESIRLGLFEIPVD